MSRRSLPFLALTASLLALPTTAGAQREPAGRFEGLVEVSEVLVDVLATDADGNVVTGLGVDDFLVTENDQPVELTNVSYYTTRYDDRDGEDATLAPGEVPSSRHFIFFFHDESGQGTFGHRLDAQRFEAGRESERWVMEKMLPSDWVAVVTYGFEIRVLQDFTQRRDAIAQALHHAIAGVDPAELAPSRRPPPASGLGPSLVRGLEKNPRAGEVNNPYEALGVLAEATSTLVGRKNLLLFTLDFGRETGNRRITRPDPRHYPQLETLLNDHNVAVYPIDLTPPSHRSSKSYFLERLATDTGGTYHRSFASFFEPLAAIGDENRGYYLLSYRSAHPAGDIGYQRLEIEARDPAIQVRARTGYRYGL